MSISFDISSIYDTVLVLLLSLNFSFQFYQQSHTIFGKIRFLVLSLNVFTISLHLFALLFDFSNGMASFPRDASPLFWLEELSNAFLHPPAQCMESVTEVVKEGVKLGERTAEAAKTTADAMERSQQALYKATAPIAQATFNGSVATIATTKLPVIKSAPPLVKGAAVIAAASYGYLNPPK